MKNLLSIICLVFFIQSCQDSNSSQTESSPDNSQTSLDWPGTYSGILPCVDCEGMETTIALNRDLSYSVTIIHRGKGGEIFTRKAQFTWNDDGNTIQLDGMFDGPSKYLVGENVLIQLDNKGQRINGNLAEQYKLTKTKESRLDRSRWNLTELLGKPFDRSTAHINFDLEKQQLRGYGWCNTFSCSFDILPDDRIKFNEIIASTHICPDTTTEKQLLNMFNAVDSYQLNGDILILSRGKVAPMAKFEGVQNVRQ